VVDKLLHEPTVRVKELAAGPNGTDYADALRALFGLGLDVAAAPLTDAVTVDPAMRSVPSDGVPSESVPSTRMPTGDPSPDRQAGR